MVFKQPLILKPSYLLLAFLLFIHLGAVITVISLALTWYIALSVIIFVIISLISNIRRYALQLSPNVVIKIWPEEDECWLLQTKQNETVEARLTHKSFCSLYLVILHFKLIKQKTKLSIIIPPDSLSEDSFRQLRVRWLMFRGN